jgi:hypothetical protein
LQTTQNAILTREISSRLEITDIYARYVHAADAQDFDTLDRSFLPETTFDWTSCGGGKMSYTEAKAGPVFQGKLFPLVLSHLRESAD